MKKLKTYNGYSGPLTGTITLNSTGVLNTEISTSSTTFIETNNTVGNGVACPKCGEEMYDTNPNLVLTSNPPKKSVHCKCGFSGYRTLN
jgi:hypothetical protein